MSPTSQTHRHQQLTRPAHEGGKKMNRTAIYARAACPNGAELNRQVQVLQGLAANLGLNVTRTIRVAASGLDFDRPGLCELMRLAERHEIAPS